MRSINGWTHSAVWPYINMILLSPRSYRLRGGSPAARLPRSGLICHYRFCMLPLLVLIALPSTTTAIVPSTGVTKLKVAQREKLARNGSLATRQGAHWWQDNNNVLSCYDHYDGNNKSYHDNRITVTMRRLTCARPSRPVLYRCPMRCDIDSWEPSGIARNARMKWQRERFVSRTTEWTIAMRFMFQL